MTTADLQSVDLLLSASNKTAPLPADDIRAEFDLVVVHAPSNRARKGTEYVIAACERLPVELDIVEGVPHDEARE